MRSKVNTAAVNCSPPTGATTALKQNHKSLVCNGTEAKSNIDNVVWCRLLFSLKCSHLLRSLSQYWHGGRAHSYYLSYLIHICVWRSLPENSAISVRHILILFASIHLYKEKNTLCDIEALLQAVKYWIPSIPWCLVRSSNSCG